MEKSQYDLCVELVDRLDKQGVLDQLILIGSWCTVFHDQYFGEHPLNPATLRTRDIDFLLPAPSRLRNIINLPTLVADMGFVATLHGPHGLVRLNHPDLIVEFLVPERGRGTDKPVKLPALGMNAAAIRFLDFLAVDTITVKVDRATVRMPHPARFALHKLIVSERRRSPDKAERDATSAVRIISALMERPEREMARALFQGLPKKWRGLILKALRKRGFDALLADLLTLQTR